MIFHTTPSRLVRAVIVLLFTGPLAMRTDSSANAGYRSMPRLSFSIVIKRGEVCLPDRNLQVEVTLTNRGKTDLVIDRDAVTYQQIFVKKKKTKPDEIADETMMSVADPLPDQKTSNVILPAGASFKKSVSISLNDSFFGESTTYLLQLTYGQFRKREERGRELFRGFVSSNRATFVIGRCQQTQASTRQRPRRR